MSRKPDLENLTKTYGHPTIQYLRRVKNYAYKLEDAIAKVRIYLDGLETDSRIDLDDALEELERRYGV